MPFVVEDEPLIRMHAVSFLEDAGYVVLEAPNADSALSVLDENPTVQAVLTDVEMPGSMHGLRLAHVVRERWPSMAVIVVSGRVLPRGEELPEGTAFMPKPYRPDAIIEAIGRAVRADFGPR